MNIKIKPNLKNTANAASTTLEDLAPDFHQTILGIDLSMLLGENMIINGRPNGVAVGRYAKKQG